MEGTVEKFGWLFGWLVGWLKLNDAESIHSNNQLIVQCRGNTESQTICASSTAATAPIMMNTGIRKQHAS